VIDAQSRRASVREGGSLPENTTPAVKYHLGEHLGSGKGVVDDAGTWANREELLPCDDTSFGSFAKKRYRCTGKERDEEIGPFGPGRATARRG